MSISWMIRCRRRSPEMEDRFKLTRASPLSRSTARRLLSGRLVIPAAGRPPRVSFPDAASQGTTAPSAFEDGSFAVGMPTHCHDTNVRLIRTGRTSTSRELAPVKCFQARSQAARPRRLPYGWAIEEHFAPSRSGSDAGQCEPAGHCACDFTDLINGGSEGRLE
jgi:hypothetical protein